MSFFLGVDTGATKSVAMVVDENGRLLGIGQAGTGNWEIIGWKGTRHILSQIISGALSKANIRPNQLTSAGFGLAGYDWPEDQQPHADIITKLLPNVPFHMVNDAFIGLWAGSEAGWGIVVSAGTSCNCYGRDAQGNIGRVTGSAHLFGEHAGAGEIVTRALQMIAKAWSNRGPKTTLSATFCHETGARDVSDLLAGLMRGRYQIGASFAPLVFKTATKGDVVAQEIISWAAVGLGDLVLGVMRQLKIQNEPFDVVMSGTVLMGNPILQEKMAESIMRETLSVQFKTLSTPPVIGAVLMGMDHVGKLTAVTRTNLLSQAKALIK